MSTTDGKKILEIDYKNLEISEIFRDEKSRDLHFSRNVNIEKIDLYDGPNSSDNNWMPAETCLDPYKYIHV